MAWLTSTKLQLTPRVKLLANNGPAPLLLLAAAALGWWFSVRMSHQMVMNHTPSMSMGSSSLSFLAFVGGWIAMMCAMMFPAIVPAVLLFRGAAIRGQTAPTPYFVLGYLFVWSAVGVPAYFAWRALQGPIGNDAPWAARFAGTVFLAAAAYQVSPLKLVCLRHCRTPMSFFMRQRRNLKRPLGATLAGATHGLTCFGCCWALMLILVALGTMQLTWMIILAALIYVEKVSRSGELVARWSAVAFGGLGASLLLYPALLNRLT
jgi:predicted metal-binding membrane protein